MQTAEAARRKASNETRAGALYAFGGALFLLLTTAAEAVYPGFNLQFNAISDLAAVGTKTTLIEETAILGLGVCWLAGAVYEFRGTGRRMSLAVNLLPGFGFLLAGLSPENVNVIIHSIGAPVAFVVGSFVVIFSYRGMGSPLKYFVVGLGALSLASTLVIFIGGQVGPCGTCGTGSTGYLTRLQALGLGLGGFESLIIYPILVWLISYGSYLMSRGATRVAAGS